MEMVNVKTLKRSKVVRSYRISAWTREHPHVIRVTDSCEMWLDCGINWDDGNGMCSFMGVLPKDKKITKNNVLEACNS